MLGKAERGSFMAAVDMLQAGFVIESYSFSFDESQKVMQED